MDYVRQNCGITEPCIPPFSVHTITTPGAVAAWVDTVQHFGSGKLDMMDILQPSIDMAENG